MAHFSASGDSIASLFIVVRIGFEPCNNSVYIILQLLSDCLARLFAFCSCHGYLCL